MNACHPTDEVRAFVIRVQPIATQTPASGVQPRLRGVLAAGGGPSNLANCPCVAFLWPLSTGGTPVRRARCNHSGAGIRGMSHPGNVRCHVSDGASLVSPPKGRSRWSLPQHTIRISLPCPSWSLASRLTRPWISADACRWPKDPRTASGWRRPRSLWEPVYGRCTSSPCSPSCCRSRSPTMSA